MKKEFEHLTVLSCLIVLTITLTLHTEAKSVKNGKYVIYQDTGWVYVYKNKLKVDGAAYIFKTDKQLNIIQSFKCSSKCKYYFHLKKNNNKKYKHNKCSNKKLRNYIKNSTTNKNYFYGYEWRFTIKNKKVIRLDLYIEEVKDW